MIFQRFFVWIAQRSRSEPITLGVLSICAGAIFGFVKLAEEVTEGDTRNFDEAILLAFRNPSDLADPLGPWCRTDVPGVFSCGFF